MRELVRKVGEGYIFYCPGCKELHYLDNTYDLIGTLENPTFQHCAHFLLPSSLFSKKMVLNDKYKCRLWIRGGILYYWLSRGHKLTGYYKMQPIPLTPEEYNIEPVKLADAYAMAIDVPVEWNNANSVD